MIAAAFVELFVECWDGPRAPKRKTKFMYGCFAFTPGIALLWLPGAGPNPLGVLAAPRRVRS